VAPARTFGFVREVETLRQQGLARGGSLDNALVYDASGPLGPERLPREVARHKLLDAMGDLALIGRPLAARVTLDEPGHALTVELSRVLAEAARR
jgi:UDP-3-O-acyl-N-acetylglucosamine deacetylase